MPKRQHTAKSNRLAHHADRIRSAATEIARLWKVADWLVAEARRAGSVTDVTRALLGLVVLVQKRLPLPDDLYRHAATIEPVLGPAPLVHPHEGGGAVSPAPRSHIQHAHRREHVA